MSGVLLKKVWIQFLVEMIIIFLNYLLVYYTEVYVVLIKTKLKSKYIMKHSIVDSVIKEML